MSLKRDNNETRAIGAGLSIGRNYARDFSAQNDILITVEGTKARPSRKDTNMTEIFLASANDMTLAFSNIGSAFTFILDSHADLNPEGSALMLAHNNTPATVKAVKASNRAVLTFSAAGADAASQVTKAQSLLDGALSACALVGVDPENVATVGNLRAALVAAQALVDTDAEAARLSITAMTLHKRGYKNS
jgi:O-antigen ligase